MGVKELLPLLKSVTQKVHLSQLQGCRVAIDASSWMYRAAMTCSKELVLTGQPSPAFYSYLRKRINQLKQYGIITMIFVFDGCDCEAKQAENERRTASKLKHWKLAMEEEEIGDANAAERYYQQAVSIDYGVIKSVVAMLEEMSLPYVMAPFEADPQLSYLCNHNLVDIVISEDSDLLAYGCEAVLFKLDNEGCGDLITYSAVFREPAFQDWNTLQFQMFCCLLGCDYVPRIYGIGVKTAYSLICKCTTLESLIELLQNTPLLIRQVELGYFQALAKTLWLFKYHIVFDFFHRRLSHLQIPLEHCALYSLFDTTAVMGLTIPVDLVDDLVHARVNPNQLTCKESFRPGEKKHTEYPTMGAQFTQVTETLPLRGGAHKKAANEGSSMKRPYRSDSFISPHLSRKFGRVSMKFSRIQRRSIQDTTATA